MTTTTNQRRLAVSARRSSHSAQFIEVNLVRSSSETQTFRPKNHELNVREIHRDLPPSSLYEHAIRFDTDASIAGTGALVAYSGIKTGRSPKDKRIAKHPESHQNLWR